MPKGKKNRKRPGSSGEDSSFTSTVATPENPAPTRERSVSKRRKTLDVLDQQHKITKYTRQPDRHRTASVSEEDDKEERGEDGYPTMPTTLLMSKLESMDRNILESKEEYRRMDQKIEQILHESFEIRKENTMLKKQIENLTRYCQEVTDDVERLEKMVKEQKEMRNNLEQYTRKENIKIINLHGDKEKETSEETEGGVIDFLHRQLGLTCVTSDHISIAHRVGLYRQFQNRPVIVKFISRKTKALVMKNRSILKGKQIYINEDLTKLNAQRLSELKKHSGTLSAWSFEGSLYCKLIDSKVFKIENGDTGVIERRLADMSPTHQHQLQRTARGPRGREDQPTLIGRAARGAGGRSRGGPTQYGNRNVAAQQKVTHRSPERRRSQRSAPSAGEFRTPEEAEHQESQPVVPDHPGSKRVSSSADHTDTDRPLSGVRYPGSAERESSEGREEGEGLGRKSPAAVEDAVTACRGPEAVSGMDTAPAPSAKE